MGTKRQVLTDRRGVPLSVVIGAANRNDMKVAAATLDEIIVERPTPTVVSPQHLCRDKGFDYPETDRAAEARGYTLHTARKRKRGQPPPALLPADPQHPARRWVVERTNSWHHRFRTLRVRFEKTAANYRGLVQLACLFIVYRLRLILG